MVCCPACSIAPAWLQPSSAPGMIYEGRSPSPGGCCGRTGAAGAAAAWAALDSAAPAAPGSSGRPTHPAALSLQAHMHVHQGAAMFLLEAALRPSITKNARHALPQLQDTSMCSVQEVWNQPGNTSLARDITAAHHVELSTQHTAHKGAHLATQAACLAVEGWCRWSCRSGRQGLSPWHQPHPAIRPPAEPMQRMLLASAQTAAAAWCMAALYGCCSAG